MSECSLWVGPGAGSGSGPVPSSGPGSVGVALMLMEPTSIGFQNQNTRFYFRIHTAEPGDGVTPMQLTDSLTTETTAPLQHEQLQQERARGTRSAAGAYAADTI